MSGRSVLSVCGLGIERAKAATHRNQFLLASIKLLPSLPSRPSNALRMVKHQQNEKYKCSQSGSGPLPVQANKRTAFYTLARSQTHLHTRACGRIHIPISTRVRASEERALDDKHRCRHRCREHFHKQTQAVSHLTKTQTAIKEMAALLRDVLTNMRTTTHPGLQDKDKNNAVNQAF